MAFQFIPPFEEGDKQTNSETQVEYIFTDGAWRPLGPKIEDQFDALDERYVNIDGDVMHGTLKFDHGTDTDANILIRPNRSNVSTSIYQLNGGALRLRSLPGENVNVSSTTHIAIGKNETDGEPETYIYHLQDPAGPQHGVNLQYLETYVADELADIDLSEYLPLTGGDMTGAINIDRPSSQAIVISKDGTENLKLWVDGTVSTTKTTFSDDNFVTKAYVDSNTPTDSMNTNGDNVVTTSWKVLGSGRTFIANSSNELGLYRLKAPSESHHAARKQDVDNHKAKARTGTSSSPTLTTGELYYNTSTKQLFIGE